MLARRFRRCRGHLGVARGCGRRRAPRHRPAQGIRVLGGRPLLAESLDRLDRSPGWTRSSLPRPSDGRSPSILLAEELAATKVVSCVTGGDTRADSVRAALADVPEDALVVLVHDAARPLLDDAVIERLLAPLAEGSTASCRPSHPGHGQARRGQRGRGDARPRRSRRCANAAGVSGAFLRRAFAGDLSAATDCASLVERAGGRVAVVDGDSRLVKVTTASDLALVELLLRLRRTGGLETLAHSCRLYSARRWKDRPWR